MLLGAPKLSNDQVTCWTCPHGFAKNETCLNYPEDKGRANTCRIGFHDHCRTLIIGNFRLIHTCAMVFSVIWIWIKIYSLFRPIFFTIFQMIQQHPGITIENALTRDLHTGWVVLTLQSPLKERENMPDENATVKTIFATIKFKSYINIPITDQPLFFPFSSKIVQLNIGRLVDLRAM